MSDINKLITGNLEIWCSAIQNKKTTGRGSSKKIKLVGIDNLRDLIIELALQGKLIKQDANDTPASHLIDEIKVKRAELTKKKLIKRQSTKVNYELLEKPYAIPSNWEWSSIGELCEITPKNELSDDVEASFIPMPMISTSYSGEHDQEVKKWGEIKKGFTHFADGDIALAKITPCFENSKAAIFKGLKNGVGSGTTELHVARPLVEKVNARYLLLFLKSPLFLSVGESKMTGSAGQKRVPKDFFTTYSLPLGPVEEQSRIVSKVDELMVLCDQLEQQTEASIDAHKLLVEELLSTLFLPAEGSNSESAQAFEQNWARIAEHFDLLFTTEHSIEQLKQTTLQLAVMGKLVPQDPNDEPASKLLERIAQEKEQLIKDKVIKKLKPRPEITAEEAPFEIPESWQWCRFPDIGELNRGKSKHRPRNDPKLYENGTIPLVQTGDVARANGIIETYTALYNEEGLAQSKLWEKGTLCITIAANIADTAVLGFEACFPDSVVGFHTYGNLSVKYFDFFIRTAKDNLEKFAPSTAQKNINLEILGNVLVPLPPCNEMERIIEKVEKLLGVCEQLKLGINASQNIQVKLAETIVEQALS